MVSKEFWPAAGLGGSGECSMELLSHCIFHAGLQYCTEAKPTPTLLFSRTPVLQRYRTELISISLWKKKKLTSGRNLREHWCSFSCVPHSVHYPTMKSVQRGGGVWNGWILPLEVVPYFSWHLFSTGCPESGSPAGRCLFPIYALHPAALWSLIH